MNIFSNLMYHTLSMINMDILLKFTSLCNLILLFVIIIEILLLSLKEGLENERRIKNR